MCDTSTVPRFKMLVRDARLSCAALVIVLAGCAHVNVRKVPTPTQYAVWNDTMQRKADSMKGLRFYLPRPFVNVFESFPVRTDVAIADGYVSPDGKYVIITKLRGQSPLANAFAEGTVKIPAAQILVSKSNSNSSGGVAATQGSVGSNAPDTGASVVTGALPNVPLTSSESTPGSGPKTGMGQQSSTNNNGAFAYQPLRGNLDVVYLPDFEEQYVVDGKAGLGNAKFQLNLGQGWSLQGFNAQTDNSEINRRIFDLVDNAMSIAHSAAAAASGNVSALLSQAAKNGVPGTSSLVTPQGALDTFSGTPNTPVTLKVVVVHYAAKGLYPVMKPRELQERLAPTTTSHIGYLHFLDLGAAFTSRFETSSTYDHTSLQRAIKLTASQGSTVPVYPYQYISFETFSYLAIEVLKPDSEPFSTLYSATGTEGAGGGRTDDELLRILQSLTSNPNPGVPVGADQKPAANQPEQNAPADQTALDSAARNLFRSQQRDPASGDRYFYLTKPKLSADGTMSADLNISKSGKPIGIDEKQANDHLLASLQAAAKSQPGVSVKALKFSNLPSDLGNVVTLNANIMKLHTPAAVDASTAAAKFFTVANVFWTSTQSDPKNPALTGTMTVELKPGPGGPPASSDAELSKDILSQVQPLASKAFANLTIAAPIKIVKD